MARLPRIVVPGQALHIIQRGNNRQPVFFADGDYRLYLEFFTEVAERYGCAIHAYVLMTNHVHILMTPMTEDGPSRCLQDLGRKYVRYINLMYKRSGTLWEGRFKSALIDSSRYLLTCYRYIELNPVRAGMVAQPGRYCWSSYHSNAFWSVDELITHHDGYLQLDKTAARRQQIYRSLFSSCLDGQEIEQIRQGTEAGAVIGNERFTSAVSEMLKRRVTRLSHGGDRKSEQFKKNNQEL